MQRNLISFIVFFSSSLFFSSTVSCSQPVKNNYWSVGIKTSGGFTGMGDGNLHVTSEGIAIYEKPGRPKTGTSPCKAELSSDELRALNNIVNQINPKTWVRLTNLNMAAADAFRYDLMLQQGSGGKDYKLTWFDNTRDDLSEDLKLLEDEMRRLKHDVSKRCEIKPQV